MNRIFCLLLCTLALLGNAAWARTPLVLPPLVAAEPLQPDAQGWYHFLKLSYKGPMLDGKPHGKGSCIDKASGYRWPCSFEHGVRSDPAYLQALASSYQESELMRQEYEKELQQARQRARAEQQRRQEAAFAGAMGALGDVTAQAEAEQQRERARQAQIQAELQRERARQAQVQAEADAAQRRQAAARAQQAQAAQAEARRIETAPKPGPVVAAAPPLPSRPRSNQTTPAAPATASTDDDPSLCVSRPEPVKNQLCAQGSAVRIRNSCEQAVDARLCLRTSEGRWDCGARYNLLPAQDWTWGSCKGVADAPFLAVRSNKSNRPLASPD